MKDLSASPYWSLKPDEVLQALESDPVKGLTDLQARERATDAGLNLIIEKKSDNALVLFLNQFKSPVMLILLAAVMISAYLSDWTDALIILAIILASAVLSFTQEYNASKAIEMLQSSLEAKAEVVRNGLTSQIPTKEIVPGDVVLLSAGSLIPADGLLLEANNLFVKQSVLTGETFPVEKKPGLASENSELSELTNVVFLGTTVNSGSGRFLVTVTGSKTSFGKIAGRLSYRPPITEFERGVKNLGFMLTEVMLILVLLIFAFNVFFQKPILDSIIFSVALAVGLTPQLLPAVINVNLSKGAKLMAKQGVLVRRLECIENFGSMDVFCTDKTGTLTEGSIQLDGTYDAAGNPSDEILRYALINAALQSGLENQLDRAIVEKGGALEADFQKIDEIPYDFIRKRLSVLVRKPDGLLLVSKGALNDILSVCSDFEVNGAVSPLDHQTLASINELFNQWSRSGFRVLGVAKKPLEVHDHNLSPQDEFGMIFLGFLLFYDPPKADVSQTVDELTAMGVELKIITGDNSHAAAYIAEKVGLKNIAVITGKELNALTADALVHRVEKVNVFAETDPNQKERIILALKKNKHVVGYMGDGINDAPSLHSADVGVSVSGAVDVAKQAADFILINSDLTVLKRGIILGRKAFANTIKYVFMAVSANFGNMFSMAVASLFLPFLPMLPKQILLINLLTDLPEMTIADDEVDSAYINKPHRWNISFIKRFMLVFGPLSSVFDILTFIILRLVLKADAQLFHSGWFVESILSAIAVVFVLRTALPILKSRISRKMLGVSIFVALMTIFLPYSPIGKYLGFIAIPLPMLAVIFLIVLVYFLSAEFVKRKFYLHHHI